MSKRSGEGRKRESDSRTASGPELGGVMEVLRRSMPSLRISHNVETLAVFGPVVHGQADVESDVNILVAIQRFPSELL